MQRSSTSAVIDECVNRSRVCFATVALDVRSWFELRHRCPCWTVVPNGKRRFFFCCTCCCAGAGFLNLRQRQHLSCSVEPAPRRARVASECCRGILQYLRFASMKKSSHRQVSTHRWLSYMSRARAMCRPWALVTCTSICEPRAHQHHRDARNCGLRSSLCTRLHVKWSLDTGCVFLFGGRRFHFFFVRVAAECPRWCTLPSQVFPIHRPRSYNMEHP
jgi:hypothetical protein